MAAGSADTRSRSGRASRAAKGKGSTEAAGRTGAGGKGAGGTGAGRKGAAGKASDRPRGRRARAEARRQDRLAKMRSKAGNRWRIHYDIDGPRVRLGIVWFAGAAVAFALGLVGVVLYFGVAFAAAAAHSLRTWRARGHAVDPTVALGSTALVVVAAGFGPNTMGIGMIVLVGIAVAASARVGAAGETERDPSSVIGRAGTVLQTTLPTALAGGCLVLLADVEIWAALSLIVLASAYETGDYLIGSGAANAYEGPLAGAAAVLVTALAIAAIGVPPFGGVAQSLAFGVAVAPLAFGGQMLGSAVLPHSRAFAPALRRVDSLLLAAPLWYVGLDRFVF